jgi:hypothetical protein
MRQVLHLLIVDRDRRAALAARYRSRWLLPVITCGEMARAAPLVARWCAERGLASDVAGQWLGRVGWDATDWLIAIPARPECSSPDSTLEWTSLDTLRSRPSVLDYQTWALATTLERAPLPSVDGPFGTLQWPGRVRSWIAKSVAPPHAWTPYRVSAHEVVIGAETAAGRVYFKGLTADRGAEATLTRALAAMAPDSFAPTIALGCREDGSVWWLAAECPGRPARDAHLVAAALVRIQRMTTTAARSLALPTLDVEVAAEWAGELLADAASGAAVRRACATVCGADVPHAWIPMDLDPTNALVDDVGAVRFIDVDDSFFGAAPLAMAAFARRCGGGAGYQEYEQGWSPVLTGIDWTPFEIAAAVVQTWLGWQRLERNIACGDVHASLDRLEERIRARLKRATYRR